MAETISKRIFNISKRRNFNFDRVSGLSFTLIGTEIQREFEPISL
jgi:hypothetical protein